MDVLDKITALEAHNALLKTAQEWPMHLIKSIILTDIASEIEKLELEIGFGIDLTHTGGNGFYRVDVSKQLHRLPEQPSVHRMGPSYNRSIGCPDNGEQPEDGTWLYRISFPSGAYHFHDSYPKELFNKMLDEIKQDLEPTYSDTTNKNFYWDSIGAKNAFDKAPLIFHKYSQMIAGELRLMRQKELEKELAELKAKNEE